MDDNDLSRRAVAVAARIARGLNVTDSFENSTHAASPSPGATGFYGSLSAGVGGLALLLSVLNDAQPGSNWGSFADEHLRLCSGISEGTGIDLYSGIGGLLFCAAYMSKGRSYGGFRDALVSRVVQRLASATSRPYCDPEHTRDFELVLGLSGTAIALALEAEERPPSAEASESLERIASYFSWLFSDPTMERWQASVDGSVGRLFGKHHNIGMAHGICGVLSTMALLDVRDAQTRADAGRVVDWILDRADRTSDSLRWPAAYDARGAILSREGWCYGTPSVALMLVNVADWLERPELCDVAASAMAGLREKGPSTWGIAEHTLCHGTAGLALVVQHVADRCASVELFDFATTLYEEVVDAYEDSTPHGYFAMTHQQRVFAGPGLLEGAGGIALALAGLDSKVDRRWKRMFGFVV
jgi:lantibiotic biosynthesis protein